MSWFELRARSLTPTSAARNGARERRGTRRPLAFARCSRLCLASVVYFFNSSQIVARNRVNYPPCVCACRGLSLLYRSPAFRYAPHFSTPGRLFEQRITHSRTTLCLVSTAFRAGACQAQQHLSPLTIRHAATIDVVATCLLISTPCFPFDSAQVPSDTPPPPTCEHRRRRSRWFRRQQRQPMLYLSIYHIHLAINAFHSDFNFYLDNYSY